MAEQEGPFTHTVPLRGPWVDCETCNGSGGILIPSEADVAVCGDCHGEGGWFEPLPPPSYTITDVTSDVRGNSK